MGVLIDASILIHAERGAINLAHRVERHRGDPFYLSVITASEMLHGVHRAMQPGTRARRAAFVEAVLERFPLLGIDLPTARVHAQVWADLASTGRLIGAHDLWLAATCLARDLTMVTANVREFERVPGLRVQDWSAPAE
jgi:tRNA(fMet)-specific endonuclease VapC